MIGSNVVTLFLSGDLMTGRGIDQALPHPGDPTLHQSNGRNASDYLIFAEKANGPISKPVDFSYIWGDTIEIFKKISPDVKIINLETSITISNDYMPGKPIHFKMHPDNISCLTSAGIDICVLANNHLLDWGQDGLIETMQSLKKVNIKYAGAGCNSDEAEMPVIWNIAGKGRVIVFSYCVISSGVPTSWEAEKSKPGVNLLFDFSSETVRHIREKVKSVKQKDDIVVFSIHWEPTGVMKFLTNKECLHTH